MNQKINNSHSKRDAYWFAVEASESEKQEILEDIVEKSNEDQRDLIEEYQKKRTNV